MFKRDAFSIPPAPLALTIAGLAPFVGAAAAMLLGRDDPALSAQSQLVLIVYAAVILSFLGGVRWGMELSDATLSPPRWGVLTASVLGALFGWALVLYAVLGSLDAWIFLAAAAALAAHWAWDLKVTGPVWYAGLRTIATAGASGALILGWAIARFL